MMLSEEAGYAIKAAIRSKTGGERHNVELSDFDRTVTVGWDDGSIATFLNAFAVEMDAESGRYVVATEHCGYHEFNHVTVVQKEIK